MEIGDITFKHLNFNDADCPEEKYTVIMYTKDGQHIFKLDNEISDSDAYAICRSLENMHNIGQNYNAAQVRKCLNIRDWGGDLSLEEKSLR